MTTTRRTHSESELPPPSSEVGPLAWIRKNLFPSKGSGLATVIILVVLTFVSVAFVQWAVFDARWGVITENMRLFLVGLYPRDEIWRIWTATLAVSLMAGLSAGTWRSGAVRLMAIMLAAGQLTIAGLMVISGLGIIAALAVTLNGAVVMVAMVVAKRYPVGRRWLLLGWAVSGVLTVVLLYGLGGATPLPSVSSSVWGGLMLTILLSVVSIALSFPIGVALALGRRSKLPVLRILSTAYIELIRAVPLVTVLFMAALLFPLLLPDEIRVDNVIRAMGGLTLFTAAYIAENVRGGLQAIPNGQVEAAQAIGLRGWQINVFIVLPQALRIVIPANVGQFISLLKDTTLVFIVGLLEILGIGRAVLAQSDWLGASFEVYAFVAAVFFVLSYTLSQASYRLEKELGASD